MSLKLPAPAKLNLFLHITGRRSDGYHNLETCFQFINVCDYLTFEATDTGNIKLTPSLEGVPDEQNLIVKAARLLQEYTGCTQGARIQLEKKLPMGGGLGGGSSNAATTLHGLNRLWSLDLSTSELEHLGLSLGADVPIFVHGHSAFASGIGEVFEEANPEELYYLIMVPDCHVNTAKIFSDPALTRDSKTLRIRAPLSEAINWQLIETLRNDCEALVRKQYPEINQAFKTLSQHADARLTGTGCCLFAPFNFHEDASKIASLLPEGNHSFIAKGLNTSPLLEALSADIEQ